MGVAHPPAAQNNQPANTQSQQIIPNREQIEWLNFWFDNGNEKRSDRVMLIGDSISREYRFALRILTKRPVDFFACSTSISDEKFYETLELFFSYKEYRQKKAQIQIGVHGINGFEKAITSNSIADYEKGFEKLVNYVLKYIPDLTIALTTAVVQANNLSVIDEKINNEIIKRNLVAKKSLINISFRLMTYIPLCGMNHIEILLISVKKATKSLPEKPQK